MLKILSASSISLLTKQANDLKLKTKDIILSDGQFYLVYEEK